jgi:alpha-amylase
MKHLRTAPLRGRRPLAALASAALLAAGLSMTGPATAQAAPVARKAAPAPVRDVVANLWEWNWHSVAQECTNVLGPKGYGAVQVAPPQDSLKRQHLGDGSNTVLHPWWEVYQAVSYSLTSRMGGEAQFASMVRQCRRAGVKVYVDAVINHMTGQGDTSYGGVTYERYRYPGLYDPWNFHKYAGTCPSKSGGIEDFNNKQQVFNCELVGLADLRTDTNAVRGRVADYLNKLIGYGVSGFRVDAAKHIGQTDLDAIYRRLHDTKEGTRPYWALEVFGGGPGSLAPQAFTRSGSVLGLDGVKQLKSAFKSYPTDARGSISTLRDFGEGSGLTTSSKTLQFVQNHDTERNGDALSYKDQDRNRLATQFILASAYGRPQVYSAFEFTTRDDSPPSDTNGKITDTNCASGWACTHRDSGVEAMVRWHNSVGAAPQRNWRDDGGNVIGFSRGGRGWVAMNNDPTAHTVRWQTGLPVGTYCDIITGGRSCSGTQVVVDISGAATVTVPAGGTVAVLRGSRR